MDEVEAGQPQRPAQPVRAGEMLKTARDAHGLSLAEIASRTRIPQRHLEALEGGDYSSLPSPTYAVGFAKAYARAAGADEVAVARLVRGDLERMGPRTPEYVPYETADPARVPSRGVTVVALGIALAVLILVGLWYGTTLFRGGNESAAPADTASTAPTPAALAPRAPPTGGQVTLIAKDDVWLRVYDASDKTLYLGTLKPGERYDVPADANDPMINVGRPDQLTVSLNGSTVPPLGTGERAIKDVRVGGAAIAARLAGATAPSGEPNTAPPAGGASAAGAAPARPSPLGSQAPRPARRLTETQRANLESAADVRRAGATPAP